MRGERLVRSCSRLLSYTYHTQLTQAIKGGGRKGGVPFWHPRWCCLLLYPILEALASPSYRRQGCCSYPSCPSPRPASGLRVCVRVVVAAVVVVAVVVVALQRQLNARTPVKEERQGRGKGRGSRQKKK